MEESSQACAGLSVVSFHLLKRDNMYADINRRQFLRGDLRGKHVSIRPPWSLPEVDFQLACSTCGECIAHCPEHILVTGGGNYPEVDFQRGECTFCGDCVDKCPTDALLRYVDDSERSPWNIKATISDSCLANHRITCLTCVEICEQEALTFTFGSTGRSKPNLNKDYCNGCGACIAPCPANAISLRNL